MQKHILTRTHILVIGNYYLMPFCPSIGWRKGNLDYMFDWCKTEAQLWGKIDKLKELYNTVGDKLVVIDERKPIPPPF